MRRMLTGILLAGLIGMLNTIIDGWMGIQIWGYISPLKAFIHIALWASLGGLATMYAMSGPKTTSAG